MDRGERLRAENLGSRYDPLSAHRGAAFKKTPSPHPLCSTCDSATRALRLTPQADTRTIYQSVGCEPDPNCRAFSFGPRSRWVSM